MDQKRLFLRHGKFIALILAFSLIFSSALGGTLAYIVTGTQSLLNTFISGLDPTGDLTIRKTLTHPFGDGYILPRGLTFTFRVDLGQDYAGKTLSTSQGDVQVNQDGTAEVTAAAGGAVTIFDLRADTRATITEILAPGFSVTNGDNPRAVTVPRKGAEVVFANAYVPEVLPYLNVRISGTKILLGRDWQEGDLFTFLLEQAEETEDGTVWNQVGTTDVRYELEEVEDPDNPGQTILAPKADFNVFDLTETLRSLTFESAGIYCFRLSEEFGDVAGVTYDSVVSYFDVVVGDADMDGFLEVQSVLGYQNATAGYDSDTEHFLVEVTVNNTYAPSGVAPASIRIHKEMLSNSGQHHSAAGFTFELYDENGELLVMTDPTSTVGEAFISMTYEAKEAGNTYYYTLKETNAGKTIDGLIYDSTEYPVAVTVVDNLDGTVRAAVYLAKRDESGETEPQIPEDAESSLALTFTNRYDPKDTSVKLSGTKELTGRDLNKGEFIFRLYETGPDFALAEHAKSLDKAKNKADGSFKFSKISYDAVGEYHYVILEDSSNPLAGVTYDDTRIHVTVTVTDAGGVLEAAVSTADQHGREADIIFRNQYRAAPVSVVLDGVKCLVGAGLRSHQFTFRLYEADAGFKPQGDPVQTAYNTAGGTFAFDAVRFDTAGDYHFVILEDDSEQAAGITYDDTVYGVTIRVRDDGQGSLTAQTVIFRSGTEEVDRVIFTNTYTEPEKPTEPDEPTKPTEPEKPTEPDVPTEPTEPEKPTEPDAPTEPTEPEKPTEPDAPTEPTEPEKPTEPDEPTKPTEPDTPTDPTKPTEPGKDPDTGDQTRLGLYLMTMTISLAMMPLLIMWAKENRIWERRD